MERRSTKHGPHVDDEMAREVRDQTQGAAAGSRTTEWRQAEPAGEDQPEPTLIPAGHPDLRENPVPPTPDEIEARSELGRWIPRTALPADREHAVSAATEAGAPEPVLEQLRALPSGQTFETVSQMWAALGHENETRG